MIVCRRAIWRTLGVLIDYIVQKNALYSSFSNFVCKRGLWGKMTAFCNKIVNKYCYRYGAHIWPVDHSWKMKSSLCNLCRCADFVTMATVVSSCNYIT